MSQFFRMINVWNTENILVAQWPDSSMFIKHKVLVDWWFFFLFSKQNLVYNEKKELLCHLIVYLLINYFDVVWMTEGKLSIRRKSCKTCKNKFKSPKIYALLYIFKFMPLLGYLCPPGSMFDALLVWIRQHSIHYSRTKKIFPKHKKVD